MIKPQNFYTVLNWMHTETGLQGLEIPVYAIVYGFSQDGTTEFTGGPQYIAELMGISVRGARDIMKRVQDKGYIVRGGVRQKSYWKAVDRKPASGQVGSQLPLGRKPASGMNNNNINNNTRAKAQGETSLKDSPQSGEKKKNPSPSPPQDKLDFDGLLKFINEAFDKQYRVINKTARQSYNARLREGYKKEDIFNAILAVKESQFGRERDYSFATPTYFSRAQSLENWMNRKKKSNEEEFLLHQ